MFYTAVNLAFEQAHLFGGIVRVTWQWSLQCELAKLARRMAKILAQYSKQVSLPAGYQQSWYIITNIRSLNIETGKITIQKHDLVTQDPRH